MKRRLIKFVIFASVLILVVGCSNLNPTTSKDKDVNTTPVSSKDNGKSSDTVSNNVKTVKTFVENELTTTNELKEALNKSNSVERLTALNQYFKERYGNLISEGYFEKFVSTNEGLMVLLPAYSAGYELKPTHIEIQLENKEFNAYTFKAEVEYSKDGKTNTSTLTGYITLNDKGKITGIRDFDDNELQNIFAAANAKK